ncbi:hypothetical protein Moror_2586 [Moniliophthora roreri MCA 2997]|uniref:Uncharacterized protein n=2 Tax=Moniliophthora roreri TaxID=221103 RepID=V2XCU3_MONRO|nr:hypothetical protein Moror_2586 [Moniliophthora roreri MCA 2997]
MAVVFNFNFNADEINLNAHTVSTGIKEAVKSNSTTLLLLVGTLYFFGPKIFEWRFPCRTTDQLYLSIQKLEALIDSNSRLDSDIIPQYDVVHFKALLQTINDRADKIKVRNGQEPARSNPFAWGMFRWEVLRDVDSCYTLLRNLECVVNAKIHGAPTED